MLASRRLLAGAASIVAAALLAAPAWAIDLTGAWATDTALCSKVFKKQGKRIMLTKLSDLYGGGFVIEGNRVRAKMARCNIESKKEDGSVIHVTAACTTEIAMEELQFDLKVVDDNTISKTFPGTTVGIDYHRCTL